MLTSSTYTVHLPTLYPNKYPFDTGEIPIAGFWDFGRKLAIGATGYVVVLLSSRLPR